MCDLQRVEPKIQEWHSTVLFVAYPCSFATSSSSAILVVRLQGEEVISGSTGRTIFSNRQIDFPSEHPLNEIDRRVIDPNAKISFVIDHMERIEGSRFDAATLEIVVSCLFDACTFTAATILLGTHASFSLSSIQAVLQNQCPRECNQPMA
jgi:hypothetical protein